MSIKITFYFYPDQEYIKSMLSLPFFLIIIILIQKIACNNNKITKIYKFTKFYTLYWDEYYKYVS